MMRIRYRGKIADPDPVRTMRRMAARGKHVKTVTTGFAAAIGCWHAAASSQTLGYDDVTATHLPSGLAGPCMDANAGDADGDGDLDLALAMEFRPNILLLNDGHGVFSVGAGRLPETIHDSEDVEFADFDADGDQDLVFVSEDDRTDELYLNDGTGRFIDASGRLPGDDVSNALAVLDLDGDGAPDLLTGNVGTDRVLINDGNGRFRDETAERWQQAGESRTQDLELADIDRDGDLDVIVGNEGQNELFLNDRGRLVDATTTNLPAHIDETREIRAADIDGDSDLDLIVANVQFVMSEELEDYLLLNDGTGIFSRADTASFPEGGANNFTVQTVDLDGDGDLDVLVPATDFPETEDEFHVIVADDSGIVSIATAPDLDLADVDRDGDVDVVVRDGPRSVTIRNEGGKFRPPAQEDGWPSVARLGDLDITGDDIADISVTAIRLSDWRNADGAAAAGAPTVAAPNRSDFLQIVDVDRDGTIDIVMSGAQVSSAGGGLAALLNDGTGRFSVASPGSVLPADLGGNGFDIEVADFNDDGVSDLYICNRASIADPGAAAQTGGLQRLLIGQRE